jgi:hypothetical protein
MRSSRIVIVAIASVALPLTCIAGTHASPRQVQRVVPMHAGSSGAVAGSLALLTGSGHIETVKVRSNGATSTPTVIGPVATAPAGETIGVSGLTASGDGHWLAWSESAQKANGQSTHSTLVIRHMTTGQVSTVKTSDGPLGFAGDTLITTNGEGAKRLILTPSPHLLKIKLPKQAFQVIAPAKHGVVALKIPRTPHADTITQDLITVGFGGQVTTIHDYAPISNDTAPIEDGWSSGDGQHLVIEHGDHTDFGGVGPSSQADELNPNHANSPTRIGHPGTAAADWRMEQTTFAGPHAEVYTVWMTAKSNTPRPVVYRYASGGWQLVARHALVVAGNSGGYVVVQPGKYVQDPNIDFPAYDVVPTGDALLVRGSAHQTLGVSGTEFAWL